MSDLKPGDAVKVFDVNGRRMGQPEGGWDGTVVKVGRKLAYIDYPGGYGRGPRAFRLDTRRSNDGYAHRSVKTPDEASADAALAAAWERLRLLGLDAVGSRLRLRYTAEQLSRAADALEVPS